MKRTGSRKRAPVARRSRPARRRAVGHLTGSGVGGGGRYTPPPAPPSTGKAQTRMYEYALRPSAEWYMLLAGLLTRAVLEGYLSGGWTGLQAVQCLMLVGFGINEKAQVDRDRESVYEGEVEDEEDGFASLDPDELPSLVEAIKILFPNLRDHSSGKKGRAEEEYEMEMLERLKRASWFPYTRFFTPY